VARSAIQLVLRYQKARGANLKQEIDDLARQGILPPIMNEWSHEVRELANDSAHPNPNAKGTNPKDARDVVEFLTFLLRVTYDLPRIFNLPLASDIRPNSSNKAVSPAESAEETEKRIQKLMENT
jgi:uncharacterized protein DUF4145